MAFPRVRFEPWYKTVHSIKAAQMVPVLLGSPRASDSWTRPAPTAAELEAERNAELRRQSVALNYAASHK
jgi:hypothetical protein